MTIPDLPLSRPRWQSAANCRGVDPALFFTTRGEPPAEAKAVCAGCTVRDECLDHALTHPELFGVWGGTSERARRPMRAARNRRLREAAS